MEKLLVFLGLFDINFLILILIQEFILMVYDYHSFKRENKVFLAKKSRFIGYVVLIISLGLFVTRRIVISM